MVLDERSTVQQIADEDIDGALRVTGALEDPPNSPTLSNIHVFSASFTNIEPGVLTSKVARTSSINHHLLGMMN